MKTNKKHGKKSTKKERVNSLKQTTHKPRPKKRGVKSVKDIRVTRSKAKGEINVVPKGAKIYSRGTSKQLRGNTNTKVGTKKTEVVRAVKGGTKTVKPLAKETSRKLKTSKFIKHQAITTIDKKGKSITKVVKQKEKKISGYHNVYNIDLPKGDFKEIHDSIRLGNFDFLDEALNRNRPIKGAGSKEPRAVFIRIIRKYRNKKIYAGGISDFDFIVRKENVRKLILERIAELQDTIDFMIEANHGGDEEEYLEGSGRQFQLKNISQIQIEFIY